MVHAEQQKHIPAVHKFYRVKGATKKVQPQAPLNRAQLAALVAAAAKGGSNTDGTMHAALFAIGGYCGL